MISQTIIQTNEFHMEFTFPNIFRIACREILLGSIKILQNNKIRTQK